MSITLFGVLWILLSTIFLFLPIRYMLGLTIVSCIFQAASPLMIGEQGISPLNFAQIFLIVKFLITNISGKQFLKVDKGIAAFLTFFCFASIITIIMPFLFEGTRVIGASEDIFFLGGAPLYFSKSHIFQIILLFLNLITVYIYYSLRNIVETVILLKYVVFSIVLCVFIGFWQEISFFLHFIPFPKDFFYSNTSRALLTEIQTEAGGIRLTSTFTEASAAGHFLATSFWALQAFKDKKLRLLSAATFVAVFLTVSGTGYVILIGGFVIFLLLNRSSKLILTILVGLIVFAILYLTGYFTIIWDTLSAKSSSDSGIVRRGFDVFTWNVAVKTYFLGIGMGSNRGNSFLINQLAAIGIIGCILYFRVLYFFLKPWWKQQTTNPNAKFLILYSVIFIIGQFISGPDLSNPVFWLWTFVAISYNKDNASKKISDIKSKYGF